ncbi:MAG: hypothetical protein ACHQDF_02215 [Chitinophagales bacterium]
MNQKILIVFTVFLLIMILLLLLLSDAKAKGGRIRILVYISGNPMDPLITDNIKFLLEKITSEGYFTFTIPDESNPGDFQLTDSNTIILQFQPHAFIQVGNKSDELRQSPVGANSFSEPADDLSIPAGNPPRVRIDPASPHVIYIAAGTDAVHCIDPDFELLVQNAILKVVSLKKNQ